MLPNRPHRLTTSEFVQRAQITHEGKYLYSKVEYIANNKKVIVTCPTHGDFLITPANHMNGRGCKGCRAEKMAIRFRKTTVQFVEDARNVHGDKYDYSKTEYTCAHESVVITCPQHGDFSQAATSHLMNHGCPRCASSSGESAIADILTGMGVQFQTQATFDKCKDKKRLAFDFYFVIHGVHVLIEYQGIQHTEVVDIFQMNGGEKLSWFQKHDKIKRAFAKEFGFVLIEVPYTVKNIHAYLISEIRAHTQGTLPNLTYPVQLNLLDTPSNQSETLLA